MPARPKSGPASVAPAVLRDSLAQLATLSAERLRQRWQENFGRPAPTGLSAALLRWALAHRMQAQALGGLSPAVLRRLHQLAADERTAHPMPQRLNPGVRLLREWRGQTHTVEVVEEGFRWQGTCYRSLSGVARAITGTAWSGTRFFGLQDPPRESR